jgi:hypothetical protein
MFFKCLAKNVRKMFPSSLAHILHNIWATSEPNIRETLISIGGVLGRRASVVIQPQLLNWDPNRVLLEAVLSAEGPHDQGTPQLFQVGGI